MTWVAAGTAAVSIGSSIMGSNAAKDEAKKERRAIAERNRQAQNAFSSVNVNGPGGAGVNFGGQQINSLVAGGVNFNDLANLGQQPGAGGVSGAPGGGATGGQATSGVGGQLAFNPNSTQGLDNTGTVSSTVNADRTDIGAINLGLGDLDPARAGLAQGAINNIGQAGLAGNLAQDPALQQLFAQFNASGQDAGTSQAAGTLDTLLQGTGGAFGGASQDLANQQANPFQQGLQNQLFGGAQDAFSALPGTQDQARQQQLDLLRQEAAPFEERAFAGLQDNQFATGRLGTTGGGIQTEAFARGLGQADLSRQITAGNEGRAAQGAQLGLANNFLGAGSGLRGMQDQLLTGAQNRFQGLSSQAAQLSGQRQGISQQQFGNLGSLLQNAFAPQTLQQQVQGGFLNNAGTALGQVSALGGDARANAALGLNAANAQASARLGGVAGTTIAPQDLSSANAFGALSSALGPNTVGNAISAIGGAFGGSGPVASTGPNAGTNGQISDSFLNSLG
jgi:hypothetical protein